MRATSAMHGDPTRGAAEVAPTAPHATAPVELDRKSGPVRFWDSRRVTMVLRVCLLVSAGAHIALSPWNLLPDTSGIELKDVKDDLTIPIDLLGEEAPAPPEPKPAEQHTEPPPPPDKDPNAAQALKPDAAPPPRKRDAGPPDAAPPAHDAAVVLADRDGGVWATDKDGGAPTDAGASEAGPLDDGGLVASADAGGGAPGAGGPRDPGSMIGMAGIVAAGQVNVTLLVNVAVIRQNPVGARLGPLLYGIPQWNDFMKGSQSTVDPMRDLDWILIYGPSLIHTDRDAVLVHYAAPDDAVDLAVEAIARRYDHGGPFDAGVAGVKASLGHADNGQRVFLRAQPHVLAVVPPDKAKEFATVLKRRPIAPKVRPGEAMRLIVKDPWRQIAIPGLRFSQSLKELRLWIVPDPTGAAEVFVEGDCTDEVAASESADALTDLLKNQNSLGVRIATRGLLNGAHVDADGTQLKLHIHASQEQLEAVLQAVAAFMGVNLPPPAGGPGASTP